MDQTGVYVIPSTDTTYEKKGSKQVNVIAKDDRRAYTLVVSSSCNGDLLPFQQVWSGKSCKSCPSQTAAKQTEADTCGFDFTWANSGTSHYSTLATMKQVSENDRDHYRCFFY
jgi:hypothetical protein